MEAIVKPLRQTIGSNWEGEKEEGGEKGGGDGEAMARVDPLNDLIRAPGHSPAEHHTHTHCTLKLCLLAITPCQSWPRGRIGRGAHSFVARRVTRFLPITSGGGAEHAVYTRRFTRRFTRRDVFMLS